jgi:hypothetical protein
MFVPWPPDVYRYEAWTKKDVPAENNRTRPLLIKNTLDEGPRGTISYPESRLLSTGWHMDVFKFSTGTQKPQTRTRHTCVGAIVMTAKA